MSISCIEDQVALDPGDLDASEPVEAMNGQALLHRVYEIATATAALLLILSAA